MYQVYLDLLYNLSVFSLFSVLAQVCAAAHRRLSVPHSGIIGFLADLPAITTTKAEPKVGR